MVISSKYITLVIPIASPFCRAGLTSTPILDAFDRSKKRSASLVYCPGERIMCTILHSETYRTITKGELMAREEMNIEPRDISQESW